MTGSDCVLTMADESNHVASYVCVRVCRVMMEVNRSKERHASQAHRNQMAVYRNPHPTIDGYWGSDGRCRGAVMVMCGGEVVRRVLGYLDTSTGAQSHAHTHMHKNQRHQYACRTCYRTHGVCMYIGLVLMGRALSNESRMRRSSLRQAGTSGRVKMARQATCTIGCRGLRSGSSTRPRG